MAFTESFGAVGMRAIDPEDLATLIPEALVLQRPVVIDVPFGEMPIPRAPYIAPFYALPMDPTPRRPHPLLTGVHNSRPVGPIARGSSGSHPPADSAEVRAMALSSAKVVS